MEEKIDEENILKSQEEADLDTANDGVEEAKNLLAQESERRQKAEELATNYKIRAEKAERLARTIKVEEPIQKQTPKAGDISTKDLYAFVDAKVPQDDIQEVIEYARLKGLTVAEALKTNVVKTILQDKAEQRNVAEAANVTTAKRISSKISNETLSARASKGELPDSEEEIQRLNKIRWGLKN